MVHQKSELVSPKKPTEFIFIQKVDRSLQRFRILVKEYMIRTGQFCFKVLLVIGNSHGVS